MANRKRRKSRRGRGRRRGSSFSPAMVVVPMVILGLVGGGYAAWANGVRIPAPSGSASGPGGDRFHGLGGVSIPETEPPQFWWTTASSVVEQVDAGYLPGYDTDRPMRRVTIPNDVLFAADSWELTDRSLQAIDALVPTIASPDLEVVVVCHSSADGPASARQPLSLKRADALASRLETKLGRGEGSIGRLGKGDSERIDGVSQDTPTGRALHRRCEVFVEVA